MFMVACFATWQGMFGFILIRVFHLAVEKVAWYSIRAEGGCHFFENMLRILSQILLNFEELRELHSKRLKSSWYVGMLKSWRKSSERLAFFTWRPCSPVLVGVNSRIAVRAYPQFTLRDTGIERSSNITRSELERHSVLCERVENQSVLAEAESLSSYNRKRLARSFESPESAPKKSKSHSPKECSLTWDVDAAMEELENFPEDSIINWSAMARKYEIPQKNGGQILKETAQKHNIDVSKLDHRQNTTPRVRRRKCRLPGGEVSGPTLPPKQVIVEDKKAANCIWRALHRWAMCTIQADEVNYYLSRRYSDEVCWDLWP